MRLHTGPTAIQRQFGLAIPFMAAAWLVTAPAVLITSSALVLMGLLTALGWVARNTPLNGSATGSLGQLLHDVERTGPAKRSPEKRGGRA